MQPEVQLYALETSAMALMEAMPGLVAMLAPDGSVQRVNRQIQEYCGETLDELRNWGTNGIVHPDDMAHVGEIFSRSMAAGTSYEIEQRLRRFDGAYRWFQNRGLPMRAEDGRVIAWYVLLIDVDDRKNTEQALAASEHELQVTIDSIPGLAWTARTDGTGDFFNRHYLDYTGLSHDELCDWQWTQRIHPADLGAITGGWEGFREAGTPGVVEARIERHDGVYRWFSFHASPLRDPAGNIVKWYGVNVDIEDRKRAALMLAGERELLELIASGKPLGAILGKLCAVVEQILPSCHCEVRTIGGDGRTFEYGVAPTLPEMLVGAVTGAAVDRAMSPCGMAVLDVRQVVVEDVASDWRWKGSPLQDRLQLCDLRAVWSTPIVAGEARVLGTVCIYRPFASTPQADDQDIIGRAVHIASIAIERARDDEALRAGAARLREAHQHLSQAQRLSRTGSFTTDVRADTHIWSEELYEILEFDRDETPSFAAFRKCIHAEDVGRFDAGFERSITGRAEFDHVFRVVTPRGNTKYLHAVAQFISESEKRPIVVGSIQDITESKRIENELRRSANYLSAGERVSLSGSFAWDIATDKIVYSEQFARLNEFDDRDGLTADDFRSRFHPDDVPIFEREVAKLVNGADHIEYDLRHLMPDGRVKHYHVFAQMVEQSDGRRECVGAVQDVTRNRTAEQALDKVRSELAHVTRVMTLGELAASIAHEVSQPLSGIITNTSACLRLLGVEPPNVEGAKRTAQRTLRDGNRASEVLARLRALFSKRDFVVEPLNLNEAALEVLAISAHDLQRRGILVLTDFDGDLPPVAGDRVQLQQVILNLILNAADAMEGVEGRARRLSIATMRVADMACLRISDTGPGLGEEEARRVFDAFFTTKTNGMGIGLSVSRAIVERHGGKLLASANDDFGTTFSFSVPLATSPAPDTLRNG